MDTQQSRDKILARIRALQGHAPGLRQKELGAAQAYLAYHPEGPQPRIEGDLIDRFEAQSRKLSASVARLQRRDLVPAEVARYLKAEGIAPEAICWPSLISLDWSAAGLAVEGRAPVRDTPKPDLVGITGCFAAIAETGTLAMVSGPDTPASMTLLPETHIALVPASRICPYMEDVFVRLRGERGSLPRALNFISGPSRTADIEQTLVLGAHGPYRVHVIILENE
ncbi:MAG: LutC/YkgG family protein [Burkholderiaceae bacterium]